MSLEFNADKQIIKSTNPQLIGSGDLTIRSGSGSDEKEVFRVQLDPTTKLPRIGVNRTGQKIERITINTGFNGSGYTTQPSVLIGAPNSASGIQAQASAIISSGSVVAIVVDNFGSGYTSAPSVTITGGNGNGAAATAFLDTVDFELDVNGAIRTSTSIISDTARILNLDIENFVTPDAKFRAPSLKTYANNTGVLWAPSTSASIKAVLYYGNNIYQALNTGITGSIPPFHVDGTVTNGTVSFKHIGYRVSSPELKKYNEDMSYPRSITPPFGDDSDKIATTEYVLDLATNDVGGRVYASAEIGNDSNNGRSAAAPVRTIKRACQIASQTKGIKETIIVSGGEYVEDNPISIPADCSVAGDSLRIVIVRPNNPNKHMFKFADKNYITGLTFRDKIDSNGDPIATWKYAAVFDDKQRIYYDPAAGGIYSRSFPVGHQIFGPAKIRVNFQTNTGGTAIAENEYVTGVNTGAVGLVTARTFISGTVSGTVDVKVLSGSFQTGETFTYPGDGARSWQPNTTYTLNTIVYNATNVYSVTTAGTSATTSPTHTTGAQSNGTAVLTWIRNVHNFIAIQVESIRAEGEVVDHITDLTTSLPITRVDGSLQADPTIDGIVLYTNPLVGRTNFHNFKENQEVEISGLPTSSPDLSSLNGKQRIYKIIRDADGRSRRIVLYKKLAAFTDVNYVPSIASVKSANNYITLSLLNSPNKFPLPNFVLRRYQDACNLIRNNISFITDEAYLQIQDEFSPNFSITSIQATSGTGADAGYVVLRVTTTSNHGYYVADNVSIFKNGLNNNINGIFAVTNKVSNTVFEVKWLGAIASLGLTSGNTYTTGSSPALSASAYVQRGFSNPSEVKCRRDIGLMVNSIIMDLEYGGNYNVIEAAKTYINGTQVGYVNNEISETVRALEIVRQLSVLAMRRWRTRNGVITDPLYTPVYSSVARYFDTTVTQDTASPACADVKSAIDTLAYVFSEVLTNDATGTQTDAGYLIARNADLIASEALGYAKALYPTLGLTADQERKCKRDIRQVLAGLRRDLVLGGNAGIVTAAQLYFTGSALTGLPANEVAATRYAFTKVKDLAIQAIRNFTNGTVATRTPTGATYNSTTGVVTVTFPTPTTPVTTSHRLAFKEGALTFSCNMGSGVANHASPTANDRNYGKSLTITNVTTSGGNQTITVNVGAGGTSAGVAHTFVSALANGTIIVYDRVALTYETGIPIFEDWNILLYGSNPLCANIASAITTEFTTFDGILGGAALSNKAADAHNLIIANTNLIAYEAWADYKLANPSFLPPTGNPQDCIDDLIISIPYIAYNVKYGSNDQVWDAANLYVTGNHVAGEEAPTIDIFNRVRDMMIQAMRNETITINGTHGYTQTKDLTITVDPTNPTCAGIATSISNLVAIITTAVQNDSMTHATRTAPSPITAPTKTYGTLYSPTITYPDGVVYDANTKYVTPRGVWDDLPAIEASPYIQNASVISFLGGGGCEIDGDKVTQPNSPFPGLELNGTASYPNQGKSMVAAQFTIVSFGGIGYRVVNDGYCQLVSVFVLFCADGVYADSGGYASVTNAATNFGIYALRARGYRKDSYAFDIGTITNITTSVTGKTEITVSGFGRRPFEHYVVKIDGYTNTNVNIEYFVESVRGVTVGPPFTATIILNEGADFTKTSTAAAVANSNGEFVGKTIKLHRPSIVNSSGHTWEFAGSGTSYNALPENGGLKVEAYEQVSENYGRVYTSGTDELGDFKVGYFARIENRTGAITFTGTVTISEVEFLKLKGGDVVVTGFDASNTLGGAFSTDSKLPTQKAVKDYISNNLGPFINKPYSTNAVPRALVELTDSGKISIDQIPALRPFNVFTVANQAARLALEGALAGDIAIQADTSTSFILNNDLTSLYLGFTVDTALIFTIGNIFTGSGSSGQIQSTEYRQGVVWKINITNAGSGYTVAPNITISGGNPQGGAVSATATCTIANGQVVSITITENNGYIGGKGYTTQPSVVFTGPGGAGVTATGSALLENRLYGDIVNNIKIVDTDAVTSSNTPTGTVVDISRVVNTSSKINSNWVSLSSNQISADAITSGVIATTRLAQNSSEANSFTFLRGDQSYAPVLQSLKGTESRYFAKLNNAVSSGASTFVFTTNANVLKGHGIVNDVTGIPLGTLVNSVVTAAGFTTVQLNNPVTQNISSATIIQFTRPTSPLIIDAAYTIGNFIDNIVIANGGSGFTNGSYFDVTLSGGTGTGLKVNIIVSGNAVSTVTVTSGGVNYNADFSVSSAPSIIGSGSGLVLLAKTATTNKSYANAAIDVKRVDDLTISADPYGSAGIARFQKSQFTLGAAGNGSVTLKTGADSGLDADLLDGAQGAYYLNASNLNAGTVSVDRMSGTYNISISGQSGNTLRLITSTNNPTSSPSPNAFSEGIIADTRNNTSDTLDDGGTKHLVLTLRNGSSGFDATFGGVRQLAFTDNNNLWVRGSGTGVTTFGSWAKMWNDLNDGPGTGLDADKLDNRQGTFYQNAYNINFGTLSDNRLPSYQTQKSYNTGVKVLTTTSNPYYDIYIPGFILTVSPFLAGQNVNLYDVNSQGTGTILITNIVTYNDADDAMDYTIISGVLQTGTFNGAQTIGTASDRRAFQDYSLNSSGTFETASLISSTGTALLKLGRKDTTASSPAIYFSSSAAVASNYNVAFIASGGSSTDGSGNLNIVAGNASAITINNNAIWNAGNLTPATNNVASTVVLRDASGNFAAGTITASLTGSASLNVLKAGDTMTGQLKIAFNSGLGISETGGTGARLTITANGGNAIISQNDNSAIIFQTDSGSERGRFRPTAAGGGLSVTGPIEVSGAARFGGQIYISPTNLNTLNGAYDNNSAADMWINYRGYQDTFNHFRSFNIGNGKGANIAFFDGATSTASIGNSATVTSQYRLYVNGAFAATSKSFKIPHPTKENYDLVYGSLEGPEHAVYVRGKSSGVIELPDYWTALVDENTLTVQLTPIGNHMSWVEKIEDNKILIGGGEAFYFVQAARKDIEPLEVEVELPVEEEV